MRSPWISQERAVSWNCSQSTLPGLRRSLWPPRMLCQLRFRPLSTSPGNFPDPATQAALMNLSSIFSNFHHRSSQALLFAWSALLPDSTFPQQFNVILKIREIHLIYPLFLCFLNSALWPPHYCGQNEWHKDMTEGEMVTSYQYFLLAVSCKSPNIGTDYNPRVNISFNLTSVKEYRTQTKTEILIYPCKGQLKVVTQFFLVVRDAWHHGGHDLPLAYPRDMNVVYARFVPDQALKRLQTKWAKGMAAKERITEWLRFKWHFDLNMSKLRTINPETF